MKNNNMKKILAAVAIIAVSTSGFAFAEYDPDKVIDPTVANTKMTKPTYVLTIDGEQISADLFTEGDHVMLPLRAMCEALGFEVTWNAEAERIELIKGPVYVTMSVGTDGYTFARTAPMKLGVPPTLVGDTTYVPDNFVSEILQMNIQIGQEGTVAITTQEAAPEAERGSATIVEIREDANQITVNDAVLGEVVLNISDDTKILDENGEEITLADLAADMAVTVEYSDVMTASLPPINTPISITVGIASSATPLENETISGVAKVSEENSFEGGLLIESAEKGDVVLLVGEETTITDAEGNAVKVEDIKDGAYITAQVKPMMTMSIPPQTPAISIVVSDEAPVALENETVTGTAVKNDFSSEDRLVINRGEEMGELVLLVSEETAVTDAEGNAVKVEDIEEGAYITAEIKPMMTMSIPPQSPAVSIIVSDEAPAALEAVTLDGAVVSVEEDRLLMDSQTMGEVVLIVTGETTITNADGEEIALADIKAEDEITAQVSPAMTRSLPPQTIAYSITLK